MENIFNNEDMENIFNSKYMEKYVTVYFPVYHSLLYNKENIHLLTFRNGVSSEPYTLQNGMT